MRSLSKKIAILTTLLMASSAHAENLKFMSGSPGGSWFPMAGAISSALTKTNADLNVQVLPGNGVQNVIGVATGKANIGLSNPITTVDAMKGREPFPQAFDNLCNVASLYPQFLQIVTTKTDANNFSDLAGSNMATLSPGSTSEAVFKTFQTSNNMSDTDFSQVAYGSGSDQATFIKDGQSDSTFLITAAPSGIITDIANARDVKVLSISDETLEQLRSANPGWSRLSIPAGTYKGQDNDVETAGFALHVVVSCDMDDAIAGNIAQAITENATDLGAVNAYMNSATLETISRDAGVPMHPGAAKYYTK
ncbi:MAG: TAXI family TRAP transporter solute-binding subunit [Rhodothermales bacterium]